MPWSLIVCGLRPSISRSTGEETASSRILPASIWSTNSETPDTPASTDPDRIAALASPPPECATYLVLAGSTPSTRASSPTSSWSVEPADPPAQRIEPGSRLKSAINSSKDRYFDFAGTTIPSLSVIIVAIGVVALSGTSEPLVSIAPSITSPVIISWYGSPEDFDTSCESPSVPPAPSTLKTSMPSSSFASREDDWKARAVVSQPPPAAAGAMIETCRVGYGCDASSAPDVPPGRRIATSAATASSPPMIAREVPT